MSSLHNDFGRVSSSRSRPSSHSLLSPSKSSISKAIMPAFWDSHPPNANANANSAKSVASRHNSSFGAIDLLQEFDTFGAIDLQKEFNKPVDEKVEKEVSDAVVAVANAEQKEDVEPAFSALQKKLKKIGMYAVPAGIGALALLKLYNDYFYPYQEPTFSPAPPTLAGSTMMNIMGAPFKFKSRKSKKSTRKAKKSTRKAKKSARK